MRIPCHVALSSCPLNISPKGMLLHPQAVAEFVSLISKPWFCACYRNLHANQLYGPIPKELWQLQFIEIVVSSFLNVPGKCWSRP